jgi:outer membrane protein assembly factor BamA
MGPTEHIDRRGRAARVALACAALACAWLWAGAAWAQGRAALAVDEARGQVARASGEAARASIRKLRPVLVASKVLEEAAREASLAGRVISGVTFTCTLPQCDNPTVSDTLRDLSGLYIGQKYTRGAIGRARERLTKTGFFSTVRAQARRDGERVVVELFADGAVLIRDIRFVGVDPPPFRDDLKKLLIYREGQIWRNDPVRRKVQRDSLEALFEKDGYFKTTVELVPKYPPGISNVVDLEFVITKGPMTRVCGVGIRGLGAMTYAEARDLALAESSLVVRRADALLPDAVLEFFSEPAYTSKTLRLGSDALVAEYRKRGYFQARVVSRNVDLSQPGCAQLAFDVSEGPRWTASFTGNTAIADETLRDALPFYETGYVDSEAIRVAAGLLERLYATRGYPFARVVANERRRDRLDRAIDFEVEEGPRLEIRGITFVRSGAGGGAGVPPKDPALGDAALLDLMGTQPFGLFDSGGFVQLEQLLSDMARLEAAYREQGFLRATVSTFSLDVDEQARAISIAIFIDEGERSIVERVEFVGQRALPIGSLRESLKVKGTRGARAFVPLQVLADGSRLVQRYAESGYPMASVETACVLLSGEQVSCEAPGRPVQCVVRDGAALRQRCDLDALRAGEPCRRVLDTAECAIPEEGIRERVRVVHSIVEGPFVRVGEILLNGNFDTDPGLIFSELPLRRGDLFDVKKLLVGQANMRSLGLFDSVSIEAIGLDGGAAEADEAQAAIIINVEEGDYQYVDGRLGIQGRNLFSDELLRRLLMVGELEYGNRNTFGLGQRFTPRLLGAIDMLQLSDVSAFDDPLTSTPQVDFLVGAELVFSDPRFLRTSLGVDRLSLTIAPYYILDLLGVTSNNLLREELGLRLELRKELDEILERLVVTGGVQGKWVATRSIDTPADSLGRRLFSPRRTVGKFYLEASLDRRDSPLNPTTGFYAQFTPQLVSGDALGGQAADALGDSFFKITGAFSFYTPISRALVLGQSVRYGHIVPLFDRSIPVPDDERYVLGGVATVRGFAETGIIANYGSWRDQLRGGQFILNYNAELRYPLLRPLNVWAATFADVGVLADCFSDENSSRAVGCYADAFPEGDRLSKVRASAGLGLRYLIADQIPLLLDYALLLDRRPGEGFGNLHFNVGYSF